jgi:hypothetical protein
MSAKFVVQPSNLEATATLLTKNGTAGFDNLSIEMASQKLVENIQRSYMSAVNEVGIDRIFNRESSWPCWKGIICCYLPFTSGAGYREIFTAAAGENHLVQVILYTALDRYDLDSVAKGDTNGKN